MCHTPVGAHIIYNLNFFLRYIQVVHIQFTQLTFYFSRLSSCSVALQWFMVSTLKIVFIVKKKKEVHDVKKWYMYICIDPGFKVIKLRWAQFWSQSHLLYEGQMRPVCHYCRVFSIFTMWRFPQHNSQIIFSSYMIFFNLDIMI